MKLMMRVLRGRASVLASFALTWQIVALMLAPTAVCCRSGQAAPTPSEMANCPMHHAARNQPCPLHMQTTADRDCHCPRLGCSQTDNGFLALFGPIGVQPTSFDTPALHQNGDAIVPTAPSSNSLAPVPLAPPPRG